MAALALLSMGDPGTGLPDVKLKGYLGERLDAMIENHVTATDVDYITAPFLEKTERYNLWQSEFWGKYMHSAVPYLSYSGCAALSGKIDRGVSRVIGSQEPDGYIGNYPEERRFTHGWNIWGIKYTMMGLLHYSDCEKGEKGAQALAACRRLCDYLIAQTGPGGRSGKQPWEVGEWTGMPSSSVLEPVMWLYRRTNEKRYLDFAAYLVEGMEKPAKGPRLVDLALKGLSVADRGGYGFSEKEKREHPYASRVKAYEMMSCYQGLLEYYEVTGREDLFKAVLNSAEDIVREELNLAGGSSSGEFWYHGRRKQHLPYRWQQETCVTITWMRLCEKLFSVTGETRWLDELEKSFYNAYLGALKADGSRFAAYTPLSGNRKQGHDHCFMHTDCCTANGPRGFLCFLRKFFQTEGSLATFNFYASALVRGRLSDGRSVAFDMYSLYPRAGEVRLTSHTRGALVLRLRKPGWCKKMTVGINGEDAAVREEGGYCILDRTWKLGDVATISFDMPVVAHVRDHHVAFTRGPVLLARDNRFNDGEIYEALGDFACENIRDGSEVPSFSPVRAPTSAMWMAFSASLPVGIHRGDAASVFFCDYASAGNSWQRNNHYVTWLPITYAPHE